MMSSGHFHAPVSLDWVKINDQENCNSKMVLMTAGKDKVVRAFGQVTVDQIAFWQVRFTLPGILIQIQSLLIIDDLCISRIQRSTAWAYEKKFS